MVQDDRDRLQETNEDISRQPSFRVMAQNHRADSNRQSRAFFGSIQRPAVTGVLVGQVGVRGGSR